MAVTSTPLGSVVEIEVQTGTNAAGEPVYARIRFRNVKAAAADADVYAVGEALAGLQMYPLAEVRRVDTEELAEAV
ncbi:MAG: DUF1659 domain-containing protein [Desulfotomaculales bacterium]